MQQPTQPDRQSPIPAGVGIVWCAWHQGHTLTARLVEDAEGARHFACFSCRQAYDLVPIADQR